MPVRRLTKALRDYWIWVKPSITPLPDPPEYALINKFTLRGAARGFKKAVRTYVRTWTNPELALQEIDMKDRNDFIEYLILEVGRTERELKEMEGKTGEKAEEYVYEHLEERRALLKNLQEEFDRDLKILDEKVFAYENGLDIPVHKDASEEASADDTTKKDGAENEDEPLLTDEQVQHGKDLAKQGLEFSQNMLGVLKDVLLEFAVGFKEGKEEQEKELARMPKPFPVVDRFAKQMESISEAIQQKQQEGLARRDTDPEEESSAKQMQGGLEEKQSMENKDKSMTARPREDFKFDGDVEHVLDEAEEFAKSFQKKRDAFFQDISRSLNDDPSNDSNDTSSKNSSDERTMKEGKEKKEDGDNAESGLERFADQAEEWARSFQERRDKYLGSLKDLDQRKPK